MYDYVKILYSMIFRENTSNMASKSKKRKLSDGADLGRILYLISEQNYSNLLLYGQLI